jgi:hypothetical protein
MKTNADRADDADFAEALDQASRLARFDNRVCAASDPIMA